MKSSGLLDTRLYDEPFLLADILALVDGEISNDKKEIIKDKFRKDRVDNSVLEDIKQIAHEEKMETLELDEMSWFEWRIMELINRKEQHE